MTVDVSPEILEEIEKHFDGFYRNPRVKRIYNKIIDGTATYLDMQTLSSLVATYMLNSAEAAYTDALERGKLPNDTLYENIVNKTMMPTLKDGHGIITEACGYVQKDLNRKSGIKLDAVEPPFNEAKALGLVQAIANRNEVRLSQNVAVGLIDVFSRSIVDDFVQANCDFQKESGLDPQISRTRGANANSECSYCAERVYTGEYKGPNMPPEIFGRHRYCHCNVLYIPMNGKIQDVWSKREYQDYREAEQKQRQYLAELDKMTPTERRLARNARARELRRAKYTPHEWERKKKLEKQIAEEKSTPTGLSVEEKKKYKGIDIGGYRVYNGSPAKVVETRELPIQLSFIKDGVKNFIPAHARIKEPLVIAGKGSGKKLRDSPRLAAVYQKDEAGWEKRVGKIYSDKYVFDIHWYEHSGIMYEHKIKNVKERK